MVFLLNKLTQVVLTDFGRISWFERASGDKLWRHVFSCCFLEM